MSTDQPSSRKERAMVRINSVCFGVLLSVTNKHVPAGSRWAAFSQALRWDSSAAGKIWMAGWCQGFRRFRSNPTPVSTKATTRLKPPKYSSHRLTQVNLLMGTNIVEKKEVCDLR